jgi:hypothetical protein
MPKDLVFPALQDVPPEAWRWPAPPFARWSTEGVDLAAREPCTVETRTGSEVHGELEGFDPVGQRLGLRTSNEGGVLTLPFNRFSRLILHRPCALIERDDRMPMQRLPIAAEEREYRLDRAGDLAPLSGRTLGHLRRSEGLFLYEAGLREQGVLRVFVPAGEYIHSRFGPTAQDLAAERWVATPRELLLALERQERAPVISIGQALLNLGLVTEELIQRALSEPLGDMPLGERMVSIGAISRADLHSALAHKMGYPLVDLTRFPIDPQALSKLSLRAAVACRAVPLMVDGRRLVLAVDRPSRVDELRAAHALVGQQLAVAIASKRHIKLTLNQFAQQRDLWYHASATRNPVAPTTS